MNTAPTSVLVEVLRQRAQFIVRGFLVELLVGERTFIAAEDVDERVAEGDCRRVDVPGDLEVSP